MAALNANQKRYVRSILESVTAYLEQINRLANADNAGTGELSLNEQQSLAGFSAELQAHITGLISEFQLEAGSGSARVPARWNVITRMDFMSVELAELSRSKLAGYGELDDAAFRRLMHRVNGIQAMIHRHKQRLGHP